MTWGKWIIWATRATNCYILLSLVKWTAWSSNLSSHKACQSSKNESSSSGGTSLSCVATISCTKNYNFTANYYINQRKWEGKKKLKP